jgi:nucleotide-binding universal stress UspA family protein
VKLERIVVGVDGSTNSVVALEWAAGLAKRVGAEVIAVHSLGLLESSHRGDTVADFESVWCAPLDGTDVPNRRIVRDGNPVSVLLAVAGDESADLLVVGSRGVGEHPERLLGSTSTQVAQQADVPVVVVPAR